MPCTGIFDREWAWFSVAVLFPAVDVASIDRRDVQAEAESGRRVAQLRESYVTSDVHSHVTQAVLTVTAPPSVGLHQPPGGPKARNGSTSWLKFCRLLFVLLQ